MKSHALPSWKHVSECWIEVLGLASCHNKNRYVTVISRDIRMYCGRFVGPSHTIHGWSPCFIEIFCIKDRESQVNKRLQTRIVLLSSIPRVSRGLHTHTPRRGRQSNGGIPTPPGRGSWRYKEMKATSWSRIHKWNPCCWKSHFAMSKMDCLPIWRYKSCSCFVASSISGASSKVWQFSVTSIVSAAAR